MNLLDRILSTAQWTSIPAEVHTDDLPYTTHEGLVPLGEDTLHVFRLSTGEQVIEKESLEALMNGPFGMWLAFLADHPEWEDSVMFAPAGLEQIKAGELSARPEATKAFVQWAGGQGLATHPERLPGLLEHLDYQTTLERQAMARRKPKLRLIRPRKDQPESPPHSAG
jgi:hypothetical protein